MKGSCYLNAALLSVGVLSVPASHAQDHARWDLPEGALLRLGNGEAKAAVYSADGTRLAVNSSIGIWVYDVPTGDAVALIPERNAESVALSPDGSSLASTRVPLDDTIRLWDAASGKLIAVLEGHTSWINSMSFSPDGATLASGSEDDTIRLWDVATGNLEAILEGQFGDIETVSFSPGGAALASGSRDNRVQLWDAESGQLKAVLEGHTHWISFLSFSPDGATLASGSYDETIRLWDVVTGKLEAILEGHESWISSLSFSPDGATLASGSRKDSVRLWDAGSGQMQNTLEPRGLIYSVSFTPDGTSLLVVSGGGRIRFWDVASGLRRKTVRGHMGEVNSVAFSSDGSTLASAHEDGAVGLWNATSGQFRALESGEDWVGRSVAFSPDGSTLAGISRVIRLWDVASRELRARLSRTAGSVSLAFSPDGATLASGHVNGIVRLWDVTRGGRAGPILPGPILQGHTGSVRDVAFSPDGATLASCSNDSTIRLWDVATGKLEAILEGHESWISSLSFSPDGSTLASDGAQGRILLWDGASGQFKGTFGGLADDASSWITSVAYSPDGSNLAGGSSDGTILLWDVVSGQLEAILEGHAEGVESVAFSPDGAILASGSLDGTILLWDMSNIPDPPIDISVPVGFDVEKWSWMEPVAIDHITNREFGTGIMGATILNPKSDDGEVQLWRYSAGKEELFARIPARRVHTVPTIRFDQTGLFDKKLFVTIVVGREGNNRPTRVVIVEPNGEYLNAIKINGGATHAFVEFSSQPGYPEGVYIYDADIGDGQFFYRLDEFFNLHLIASHTIPAGRGDIDPLDLKADPTGKYGGLLTVSETDPNHDGLSGLYQLEADGEWKTLVSAAPVSERQFQGIAFSDDGPLGSGLYVADAAANNISIASPRGDTEAFAVGFASPKRVAIGPEGTDMWVTDQTGLYRIFSTDPSDRGIPTAISEPTSPEITHLQAATGLAPNYPNPFNSSTLVPFRVSASGQVRLVIFNALGQPVRTLVDEFHAAGAYKVPWDGRDHQGKRVANGAYLYRLQAGSVVRVRKMMVLE